MTAGDRHKEFVSEKTVANGSCKESGGRLQGQIGKRQGSKGFDEDARVGVEQRQEEVVNAPPGSSGDCTKETGAGALGGESPAMVMDAVAVLAASTGGTYGAGLTDAWYSRNLAGVLDDGRAEGGRTGEQERQGATERLSAAHVPYGVSM